MSASTRDCASRSELQPLVVHTPALRVQMDRERSVNTAKPAVRPPPARCPSPSRRSSQSAHGAGLVRPASRAFSKVTCVLTMSLGRALEGTDASGQPVARSRPTSAGVAARERKQPESRDRSASRLPHSVAAAHHRLPSSGLEPSKANGLEVPPAAVEQARLRHAGRGAPSLLLARSAHLGWGAVHSSVRRRRGAATTDGDRMAAVGAGPAGFTPRSTSRAPRAGAGLPRTACAACPPCRWA